MAPVKLNIMGYRYVRSSDIRAYTDEDVIVLKRKGYKRGNPGTSYVHMVKPCEARILFEEVDGKIVEIDLRKEICAHYGVQNLRKERVEKFIIEVLTGMLTIERVLEVCEDDPRNCMFRYRIKKAT